jgi:peptidoglycan/xylan/chitin deacetylase (PgdA/CDA1 family)
MEIQTILLRPVIRALARRRASVLVFHSLPADVYDPVAGMPYAKKFELVLDTIQEHFEVVPLAEVLQRLRQGRSTGGTVSITFDDGYLDWSGTVCPILRRRNLPATFFVTTSQLCGEALWSERVSRVVQKSRGDILEVPHTAFSPIAIGTIEQRLVAADRLTSFLKYLRVPFRDNFITQMEERNGYKIPRTEIFDEAHLRTIHRQGFDIGSHTVNHPILTYCDENEALLEIKNCRECLQSMLDAEVPHFAYPNGKPMADFSARDIRLVKLAGYSGAVTTAFGSTFAMTSPYQVPRFTPWGKTRSQTSRQLIGNLIKSGEQISEE